MAQVTYVHKVPYPKHIPTWAAALIHAVVDQIIVDTFMLIL